MKRLKKLAGTGGGSGSGNATNALGDEERELLAGAAAAKTRGAALAKIAPPSPPTAAASAALLASLDKAALALEKAENEAESGGKRPSSKREKKSKRSSAASSSSSNNQKDKKRRRRGKKGADVEKNNDEQEEKEKVAEKPAGAREAIEVQAAIVRGVTELQEKLDSALVRELTDPLRVTLKRDVGGAAKAEKAYDKAVRSRDQTEKAVQKHMGAKDVDLHRVGQAEAERDDARKALQHAISTQGRSIALANERTEADAVARSVNLLDAHAVFFEAGLEMLLALQPQIERLRAALDAAEAA